MNWILAFNSNDFDILGAYKKNFCIDWTQRGKFEKGDVIFFYSSKPDQCIRYKALIIDTNLTYDESINDAEFWHGKTKDKATKNSKFMRLELLESYDKIPSLSLDILKKHGLKDAVQSKQGLHGELEQYILDTTNNTKLHKAKESYVVTKDEYKEITKLKDSELTTIVPTNARKEQSFLRNYLFGDKKTCKCGICGKEFTVDLLVTSHIKKRCACSQDEKLDYKNVVMPMCSFGCDKAFEEGYIFVDDKGIIRINKNKEMTQDMKNMLKDIDGRKCEYFNDGSAKYFKYHRESFK